jgi:hypothetical protein
LKATSTPVTFTLTDLKGGEKDQYDSVFLGPEK